MSTSSWMKDIQDRVKRASNDVNTVLQPRVAQAKRSLEASIQQLGLKAGPELFHDDKPLFVALSDLDAIRDLVAQLSKTVEQYRSRLLDVARTQTALSTQLQAITPPPSLTALANPNQQTPNTNTNTNTDTTTETNADNPEPQQHAQPDTDNIPTVSAIDSTPSTQQTPPENDDDKHDNNSSTQQQTPQRPQQLPNNSFLSQARVNVQTSLAQAEASSANSVSRFALDMGTPMADLARTFEETLVSKITPLRRRYLAQKKEYVSYSKQAADADSEDRRRQLLAIADASSWKATSTTLLAEVRSLIAYTLCKFSEWNLNVAQAQHQMFNLSAAAFQQPAALAEAAENDETNNMQVFHAPI